MAGRDLNQQERDVLESFIDSAGLVSVLQSLSVICGEKADHIESSYADKVTAHEWRKAEGSIGLVSTHAAVSTIGEP